MKTLEKWKWRIRWGGRWTTSRVHFTEVEIRREHPEAERVEGSCITVEVPLTADERTAAQRQRGDR